MLLDETTDIPHLPDVNLTATRECLRYEAVHGKAENVPLRTAGFDRVRIYNFGRFNSTKLILASISST